MQKRVNVNNGRWKRICQINSAMRIKNNDFAWWDGITWLTSGLILLHSIWHDVMVILKCPRKVKVFLYNGTELSYKTVFKQQASASESNDRIYCVSSARSEAQVIYIYAFSTRFYPKRLTVHSGYTFVLPICVFPGNRTHNLCAANAMLYHWATGTYVFMHGYVFLWLSDYEFIIKEENNIQSLILLFLVIFSVSLLERYNLFSLTCWMETCLFAKFWTLDGNLVYDLILWLLNKIIYTI